MPYHVIQLHCNIVSSSVICYTYFSDSKLISMFIPKMCKLYMHRHGASPCYVIRITNVRPRLFVQSESFREQRAMSIHSS